MSGKSSFERSNTRRYFIEIGVASVLYVAAILGVDTLLEGMPESDPWRIPLALIPVLPALAMVIAVVRFILRSDELQRLIHLKGAMVAAVTMIMFCIGYGLLEKLAGLPAADTLWIGIAGVVVWPLGGALIERRYR